MVAVGPYLHWEFLYLLDRRGNDSRDHRDVSGATPFIQRWDQQPSRPLDRRHSDRHAHSFVCHSCHWLSQTFSAGTDLLQV